MAFNAAGHGPTGQEHESTLALADIGDRRNRALKNPWRHSQPDFDTRGPSTSRRCPNDFACCCASLTFASTLGPLGLTNNAISVAVGTSSCSNCKRFINNSSDVKKLIPVALPPGRARVATSPWATGSAPVVKTMGMVEVAPLAASPERVPPVRRLQKRGVWRAHRRAREVDRIDLRRSEIRSSQSCLRCSLFRSALRGTPQRKGTIVQRKRYREIRSPA